jgi:hypothetical protein
MGLLSLAYLAPRTQPLIPQHLVVWYALLINQSLSMVSVPPVLITSILIHQPESARAVQPTETITRRLNCVYAQTQLSSSMDLSVYSVTYHNISIWQI